MRELCWTGALHIGLAGSRRRKAAMRRAFAHVGDDAYLDYAPHHDPLGSGLGRRPTRKFLSRYPRRTARSLTPRTSTPIRSHGIPNGHSQTTVHSDEPPSPHL